LGDGALLAVKEGSGCEWGGGEKLSFVEKEDRSVSRALGGGEGKDPFSGQKQGLKGKGKGGNSI